MELNEAEDTELTAANMTDLNCYNVFSLEPEF